MIFSTGSPYLFHYIALTVIAACAALFAAVSMARKSLSQKKLRESERRFRALYRESPIGMGLFSPGGDLMDVNRACLDIFDLPGIDTLKPFNVFTSPFLSDDEKARLRKGETVRREILMETGSYRREVQPGFISRSVFLNAVATPLPEGIILFQVQDITDRKRSEEAMQALVSSTIGNIGRDFFDRTVRVLRELLGTDCALIGEVVDGDSVRTLSMLHDGVPVTDYLYKLTGTPCEKVLQTGFQSYPERVSELFPDDTELESFGAEGYAGIALHDEAGRSLGVMCVFSRRKLHLSPHMEEVMRIIASRASVEIERMRTEEDLRKSSHELAIRNRITEIFLTASDSEMYEKVLQVILEVMESRHGIFGYLDADGSIVCPSMTRDVFEECMMPEKSVIFFPDSWTGMWKHSLHQKEFIVSNEPFAIPSGHIPMQRVMIAPIVYQGKSIGVILIGNKKTDYTSEDRSLMEAIVSRIATVLFARLEREREEKERKHAEEQLVKFKQGIEQSEDVMFMTDITGRIVYMNPSFQRVYGYSPEEILGRTPRILRSGRHTREVYRAFWSTLILGETVKGEFINRTRDGGQVIMEASANPIIDDRGKMLGFLAIQRDITRRKQAEEELRQAKKAAEAANIAKSLFLANMSHELRTPLNGILGMAQLLQEPFYGNLNSEQMKFTESILGSGYHLLDLINEILDLSKIESGMIEYLLDDFKPSLVVDEVVTLLSPKAREKNLAISVDVDRGIQLHNDERKFKQVLLNLLGNAIKYTEPGGSIEIFSNSPEGPFIEFSVRDTGIGIRESDFNKIFQFFQQLDNSYARKGEGAGLGLALSRKLLEGMGGTIWFTSEFDKGSVFTFSLPREEQTTETVEIEGTGIEKSASPMECSEENASRRLMLVEDNSLNADVVINILNSCNYRVVHFDNAIKAIEYAREQRPDLILMDIQLPGMDGVTAARILKGDVRTVSIPIFALTAYAQKEDEQRAYAAGFEQYFTKPLNLRVFLKAVGEVFSRLEKKS